MAKGEIARVRVKFAFDKSAIAWFSARCVAGLAYSDAIIVLRKPDRTGRGGRENGGCVTAVEKGAGLRLGISTLQDLSRSLGLPRQGHSDATHATASGHSLSHSPHATDLAYLSG